jgi:hypothetical protein
MIRVLLGDMAGTRGQLIEHSWVRPRPVGADLARPWGLIERAGEESVGGCQIPLLRHQNVDDLPELVDRAVKAVKVDPSPRALDGGVIGEPPITRGVPTGPGGVDHQGSEALYPPEPR